jgi:predicted ribosome quality control (RQC) complex YloA/Tae2 family protein
MSLNWKEIDTILGELRLEGSFIQKIRQPNYHSLLFDLYNPDGGRYRLLIELKPGACRLHSLSKDLPADRTGKLQRFAQLLRSRLQGALITRASQLGGERIIRIEASHHGEITRVYIRLWSNAANIIATDAGDTIIDAFYRRPNKREVSGEPCELSALAEGKAPSPAHGRLRESYDHSMSFNAFIESTYETETRSVALNEKLEELEGLVSERRRRLTRLIDHKRRELESAGSLEQLKNTADNLAASAHLIQPGSQWTEVPDYSHDGEPVAVKLDEKLSGWENVEAYYQAYSKAKRTAEHLKEDIQAAKRELEQLEQEHAHVLSAEGDLEKQREAARKLLHHIRPETGRKDSSSAPGLSLQSGLFTILVGRTAKENDQLLRSYTRGNDYWLHTRDYPGGYVFIKYIAGKSVPLQTLLDAGNLALYFSKARSNGKADLYYTQVKHLRRAKGAAYGTVLPTHEKNLAVELDRTRIERLFGGDSYE